MHDTSEPVAVFARDRGVLAVEVMGEVDEMAAHVAVIQSAVAGCCFLEVL